MPEPDSSGEIDFDTDSPIAVWEAAKLPNWTWEAYEIEERDAEVVVDVDDDGDPITEITDVYFGRVKSPNTHGGWDVGSFTARDLKVAWAFRVDEDTGDWP